MLAECADLTAVTRTTVFRDLSALPAGTVPPNPGELISRRLKKYLQELPKFNKSELELKTVQDQWLYFIKNAGCLEYVPKNIQKELEKAFAIANEANLTMEELDGPTAKKA